MFRLCSKISITNSKNEVFTFDSVRNVEATTSWDSLVDTARVELPKNIFVRKNNTAHMVSISERTIVSKDPTNKAQNPIVPLFSVSNRIKIELGYDFDYNLVLEGIITDVSVTVPIVLQCADPMWLLGKIKLEKEVVEDVDKNPPTLEALLGFLTTQFQADPEIQKLTENWKELKGLKFSLGKTVDFTLADFSVKNKTILAVLEELKKVYHLYSYYNGSKEILCGDYYQDKPDLKKIKKFNFQNNVISEELIDKKKDSVKVQVVATNIEGKGTSATNTVGKAGSTDSSAKTIYLEYHKLGKVNTEKILESIAERRLKTISYDGYTGYFLTFGKPFVAQGEAVKLIDDYVKDRNGVFRVKQVDYSFGDSGFRQKVYLHLKEDSIS